MATRVDPHVKVINESVRRRAKRLGIEVLVYAPHFVRLPDVVQRARAFSDDELTVLPAREIFTGDWRHRRHLLAIGLEEPVPDFITLDGALTACERQDASVLVPHPTFTTVSLSASEIRQHCDRIDAIEVYNPKFFPHHERRASRLASECDLAIFGSSYAHLPGSVGEVWTDLGEPIGSVDDLRGAVTRRAIDGIGRRGGWRHRRQRMLEVLHLFWENSWQKFDRVVLRDREATHPAHPAYCGRFDDVAVY